MPFLMKTKCLIFTKTDSGQLLKFFSQNQNKVILFYLHLLFPFLWEVTQLTIPLANIY